MLKYLNVFTQRTSVFGKNEICSSVAFLSPNVQRQDPFLQVSFAQYTKVHTLFKTKWSEPMVPEVKTVIVFR